MAMKVKVDTKGISETLEALARLGADVDAVADRMVAAGGEVFESGMKRRAPKDTHNLENHIQVDGPHQDGNFHFAEVGLPRNRALVDADTARYGTAQEYGTSDMAAQPYVRPTIDSEKGKAHKAMLAAAQESNP